MPLTPLHTATLAALLVASAGAALPWRAWGAPPPLGLDTRIAQAALYLHAQIGPDGRMVYRRDGRTGQADEGRYNLLRHAGTLLAMAEDHQEHPPTAEEAQRIGQGLAYLRRCCIAPSEPDADDLAVWSQPAVVAGRRSYPVAKLGGAGLTLAAMAQWRRVWPGQVALADMQALGRFILSMQQPDGRFRSLHAWDSGQHDPHWVSLYYPGEAALGLILLYEHDGNLRWLEAAIDALRALAREREAVAQPPPDHWALLATARLWQQDPRALQEALPDGFSWQPSEGRTALAPLLLGHALSVAHFMQREQARHGGPPCAEGGFDADGRSTPTATRLEGLQALLPLLPEGAERQRVRASVDAAMAFLVAAQLTGGPATGAFSRVSVACVSQDRRAHEVRIDYVQHALAAMQAYRSLQRGAGIP
jgi:hypothetical protein